MKISSKSDVLSNLILPNQINLSGQISLSYRYRLIFQGKKKALTIVMRGNVKIILKQKTYKSLKSKLTLMQNIWYILTVIAYALNSRSNF